MKSAIDLAIDEIGTVEWASGSNPKVVGYYRDAGHPEIVDDAVSWCAAFVGAMLKRSGVKPSGSLLARSYLKWGNEVPIAKAQRGDIGIIPRGEPWQGHVFFVEKIENGRVYAVGGNQKDSVNRTTFAAASLIGVRRAVAAKPAVDRATESPVSPHISPAKQSTLAAMLAFILSFFRKGA